VRHEPSFAPEISMSLSPSHSPITDGVFPIYNREPIRPGIRSSQLYPRCFVWRYCRRSGREGQEKTLFVGVFFVKRPFHWLRMIDY